MKFWHGSGSNQNWSRSCDLLETNRIWVAASCGLNAAWDGRESCEPGDADTDAVCVCADDQSRVVLSLRTSDSDSDYINASFIKVNTSIWQLHLLFTKQRKRLENVMCCYELNSPVSKVKKKKIVLDRTEHRRRPAL